MTIWFFDSGIWGLTVLKEAIKILPNENYIYYADSLNTPYWNKTKDEVKKLVLDWVNHLVSTWIKALVIACNTATIVVIEDLRKKYSFPIIGMEPAVKFAVEKTRKLNKKILVLATCLTLQEERFQNLVSKHNSWDIIDILATQELVQFAENHIFDDEIILPYLREKLEKYNLEDYETIVLGCTHFPLFYKNFVKLLPEHITIVDWSNGTINRLKFILDKYDLSSGKNEKWTVKFYNSWMELKDEIKIRRYFDLMNI